MNGLALCIGALAVLWALDRYTAGQPFHALDGKLFYGYRFAVDMVASLSPQARRAYIHQELKDLGFIAFYAVALIRLLPRETLWLEALAYAPAFTAACDVLETGAILLALKEKLPLSALWIPTVATPLKWLGVGACLLALLTRRWPPPRRGGGSAIL